jgi:hypothetical protein
VTIETDISVIFHYLKLQVFLVRRMRASEIPAHMKHILQSPPPIIIKHVITLKAGKHGTLAMIEFDVEVVSLAYWH